MPPATSRRQLILMLLLGAALLGMWLALSGIAATLQLGDTQKKGFLLVPDLPTPLYVVMALVVVLGIGLTLLASFMRRRRQTDETNPKRQQEAVKTPWQAMVSLFASLTMMILIIVWLIRHGDNVESFLTQLRANMQAVRELLREAPDLVQQVSSPTTGYAVFVIVIIVYGGLALLSFWVLWEDRHGKRRRQELPESPHIRRVRRAMTAGLRELREHTDPRQAIIACYARLEHLLEDHGMPVAHHLTPQEYMGAALQAIALPTDVLAELVGLFELARYSLHPLDNAARMTAIAHLEQLKSHLEGEAVHALHA